MSLKRYWVLAGEIYYPRPGLLDLRSVHDTFEDAQKSVAGFQGEEFQWWQIFDSDTCESVGESLYEDRRGNGSHHTNHLNLNLNQMLERLKTDAVSSA